MPLPIWFVSAIDITGARASSTSLSIEQAQEHEKSFYNSVQKKNVSENVHCIIH